MHLLALIKKKKRKEFLEFDGFRGKPGKCSEIHFGHLAIIALENDCHVENVPISCLTPKNGDNVYIELLQFH